MASKKDGGAVKIGDFENCQFLGEGCFRREEDRQARLEERREPRGWDPQEVQPWVRRQVPGALFGV